MRRTPLPRVVVGELEEPAHQLLPAADRVLAQPTGRLLGPPATQHRLDHRVLRAQLHHSRHQLEMRRTCQLHRFQATLRHLDTLPVTGRIMQQTGAVGVDPWSGPMTSRPRPPTPRVDSAGDLGVFPRLTRFPRVQVDLGGLDAFVAEPERDDGDVDADGEQAHRAGVTQDVRRHGLGWSATGSAGSRLRACRVTSKATASLLSGPRRRLGKSGSHGSPRRSASQT